MCSHSMSEAEIPSAPLVSSSDFHCLNREGLFPAPGETREQFARRVVTALHLGDRLEDLLECEEGLSRSNPHYKEILSEAHPLTETWYGMAPSWIPAFFSHKDLLPWHAGCAWIFQESETEPVVAFFQLRPSSGRWSGWLYRGCSRAELVAHEIAHIGRAGYNEPKFEEFLAYQSSSSCWRRFLGPIVEKEWESSVFVLLLGGIVFLQIFFLLLGGGQFLTGILWLWMLPIGWMSAGFVRLLRRHSTYARLQARLLEIYHDSASAQALLYRLTDEEICAWSGLSSKEITDAIWSDRSFRWEFLRAVYPIPVNNES